MDRRNFFRALAGGAAAAVAVRSWPFRVFSFPTLHPAFKPLVFPGDFIHTMDGGSILLPGQMIAIYGADGGLCRGAYRIVDVGGEPNTWQIEYLEKMPARNLLWKPNETQWAAWQRKLQRA